MNYYIGEGTASDIIRFFLGTVEKEKWRCDGVVDVRR